MAEDKQAQNDLLQDAQLPTTLLQTDGRVLVVGDIMLDRYWFGEVERISPEAPVPVVRIRQRDERLGGAANVARNAVSLGAQVGLMGVVGHDDAAKEIEHMLTEGGIEQHLVYSPHLPTTIKLRVLGRQQQLLRVDFEEKPTDDVVMQKKELFADLVHQYSVVIFSDYGKGALQRVDELMTLAKQAGAQVLIDPKGDDYSKYRGATMLSPNRQELRQVVGQWHDEADLTRRAQALREELQLEALLLTRSEEGMTLYTADGSRSESAVAREVFDVSGAGDTVLATMAVMLSRGIDLTESMHIANRAAGIVVGKLGTAVVTQAELDEALRNAPAQIRFVPSA